MTTSLNRTKAPFYQPELSTTLLRITLGLVLLAHSVYLKAVVFTLPGTAQYFASIGLPSFSAYVVFAVEAIAGIGIVLGYQTRWLAVSVIPVLIGATWAHSGNGWLFTNANGGWEYPVVLVAIALAQIGLGDGKFALGNLQTKHSHFQPSAAL